MTDYLFSLDWDFFFNSTDIESLWSSLSTIIKDCCDKFIPKSSRLSSRYPKWFDGAIRHNLNKIRSLRKKVRSKPSPDTESFLQRSELSLQEEIVAARSQFEASLVNQFAFHNDAKIFRYINSFHIQHSLPTIMNYGSVTASTDWSKAALFNEYFHSVFTSNSDPPDLNQTSNSGPVLEDFEITVADVFKGLSSLNVHKSAGPDGFPAILLKSCAVALCEPVHHIFHQCYTQSYLPEEWKTHKVTPVYKSGDRSSIVNYRPISLLCIISKVYERIVYDKIYGHLVDNIISNKQFGFLSSRSTLQQLLLHLNSILTSLSQGCQCDVIYLDIRKAFDSVSHSKLLTHLWDAGIRGLAWKFFHAWPFTIRAY